MIYKEFQGKRLSALGLGCMRLPTAEGDGAAVDQAAAEELVDRALEGGVNYFDTAWGYHKGNSELVMGRILARHPRDSFYLADKFPGYDLANMDKVEEIFETQLEKCQVDRFDFYLFHNVCEKNVDAYLDPKYGILDYLLRQKQAGRIGHLGFSCHGAMPVLERFLDAYGLYMEFCQLQLNYVDWLAQKGKEKAELLERRQIPLWVMEPLRGGKLARLRGEETAGLEALDPGERAPGWAFRFVRDIPGTTVVLSGMSDCAQLQENLDIFSRENPLTQREREALLELGGRLGTLACTACGYCVEHCPQNLEIPRLMERLNWRLAGGEEPQAPDKGAAACVGCRSCEAVCPQQLEIAQAMARLAGLEL